MKNRPASVRLVYWMQWIGISIYGVLIIWFGPFFISGGSSRESFKAGLLGNALGIHAQEYNAEYFGMLVGKMFIPICLLLISLWSIKKYMFKTLAAFTIIHMFVLDCLASETYSIGRYPHPSTNKEQQKRFAGDLFV